VIIDNFCHIGGHSLLAARLVNRIERNFGKKIPLATIFAAPTIEELASAHSSNDDAEGEHANSSTMKRIN